MKTVYVDPDKWLRRTGQVGVTKPGGDYRSVLRRKGTGRQCCLGFMYRQLFSARVKDMEENYYYPNPSYDFLNDVTGLFFDLEVADIEEEDRRKADSVIRSSARLNDREGLGDEERIVVLNNLMKHHGIPIRFKLTQEASKC